MSNQYTRERGYTIDISAYVEESEREKKSRTISIGDEKINDNENDGDNPMELLSNNKERDNTKVWGSEARMVDNYKDHTPVVDGLIRTIVEYCGYQNDENDTGKNRNQSFLSLSTVRAYVTALREALRSYLLEERDGI